jgi:hypothetical protein
LNPSSPAGDGTLTTIAGDTAALTAIEALPGEAPKVQFAVNVTPVAMSAWAAWYDAT